MVSNATKDKMMVMPLFPDIIESKSFIFDDLSNIEKFHKIDLSKAIKTEDKDLLLAFRDIDGVGFPASIVRIKGSLKTSLQNSVEDKTILGVFRERNGVIETLSVNDDLIHDKGEELKAILENNSNEVEQTAAEENAQTDKTEGESYRLTQARQKLERLENEFNAAVQDVFDHQKLTNGQPMNDKRTGGAFFKKQNQKRIKQGIYKPKSRNNVSESKRLSGVKKTLNLA